MDLPPVDFETLKCSQCKKYLSVPPIYVYPDSKGKDRNVCGRCGPPTGKPATRNTTFESLAKILKFPCSVSKNCKEKLTWDRATEHETTCLFRQIRCPLCNYDFLVTGITNHFNENHSKNFFEGQNLTIKETDIGPFSISMSYLVVYPNITCLVTLKVELKTDPYFQICVEPLFLVNKLHLFSVTFCNDDSSVCFKNNQMKISHSFDMIPALDILRIKGKEFKIEIKIFSPFLSVNQKQNPDPQQPPANQNPPANDDGKKLTVLKEMISNNLKCQTCSEIMLCNIYTCERGHSVCDFCHKVLTVCRLCQGPFLGARNFSLEEISRRFASLV